VGLRGEIPERHVRDVDMWICGFMVPLCIVSYHILVILETHTHFLLVPIILIFSLFIPTYLPTYLIRYKKHREDAGALAKQRNALLEGATRAFRAGGLYFMFGDMAISMFYCCRVPCGVVH